ncbi:MAG: hypothetical protein WCF84_10965 [Anaerolineae bacterium]
MLSLPIVYYGRRGLEADIFETYMRRAGYSFQMVPVENESMPEVVNQLSSVAVISLDCPDDWVLLLTQMIQLHAEGCIRIFVLAGAQNVALSIPFVDVIACPYRLGEVVKRIQHLSRSN